jgi:hypothetical protein
MMTTMTITEHVQVLTWGCGAKGQLGYGMERALLQTSNMHVMLLLLLLLPTQQQQ